MNKVKIKSAVKTAPKPAASTAFMRAKQKAQIYVVRNTKGHAILMAWYLEDVPVKHRAKAEKYPIAAYDSKAFLRVMLLVNKLQSSGGFAAAANMTPAQRQARAQKAAAASAISRAAKAAANKE